MAFWLHQWIYPPFPPLLYRELRWEIESSGSNLRLHWGRHTTTTTGHRHATVAQIKKIKFKILCFKCTITLLLPLYHQPTQACLSRPKFELFFKILKYCQIINIGKLKWFQFRIALGSPHYHQHLAQARHSSPKVEFLFVDTKRWNRVFDFDHLLRFLKMINIFDPICTTGKVVIELSLLSFPL